MNDNNKQKSDKYGQSVKGDVNVSGFVNASTLFGDASGVYFNTLYFQEQSADPDDPPDGMTVVWMSDGTGAGDDGDIMAKVTAGGSTGTATVIDKSAL
jgi:hypothetical protein